LQIGRLCDSAHAKGITTSETSGNKASGGKLKLKSKSMTDENASEDEQNVECTAETAEAQLQTPSTTTILTTKVIAAT
jgi:hypothetical protein